MNEEPKMTLIVQKNPFLLEESVEAAIFPAEKAMWSSFLSSPKRTYTI